MAKASITLTGDKELIRNLKNLGPRARKGANLGLAAHGEEVATNAKGRTPVDTGTLRSTIHRRAPGGLSLGADAIQRHRHGAGK
jgi:hypothetical protein